MALLKFDVEYSHERSHNQFIGQKIGSEASLPNTQVKKIMHAGVEHTFRVNNFIGNKEVYLVYTGLLTDPEITQLYMAQNNPSAKKAIIAECKEIQIGQLSN